MPETPKTTSSVPRHQEIEETSYALFIPGLLGAAVMAFGSLSFAIIWATAVCLLRLASLQISRSLARRAGQ